MKQLPGKKVDHSTPLRLASTHTHTTPKPLACGGRGRRILSPGATRIALRLPLGRGREGAILCADLCASL